jgi:hypothetical protein
MKRFKGIEVLMFVLIAGLIWLAMKISQFEVSREFDIEFIADQPIVGTQYLNDTSASLAVTVHGAGLNGFFMGDFEMGAIVFKASAFLKTRNKTVILHKSAITQLLQDHFGREYNYTLLKDSLTFRSEPLVRRKVPVLLSNPEDLLLPLGYAWKEKPVFQPDSVELTGPEFLLNRNQVWAGVERMNWVGENQVSVELRALPKGIKVDQKHVKLKGTTEPWVDTVENIEFSYKGARQKVVVWLSGPKSLLTSFAANSHEYLSFKVDEGTSRVRLDVISNNELITIIDIQPKYLNIPQ